MAERDQAGSRPSQSEDSRQSAQQGTLTGSEPQSRPDRESRSGIGSSQGQDRASRDEQQTPRPSAGTADVERGADAPGNSERARGSEESLVHDSTGAFKERP
jgi:hypothetical protein